MHHLTRLLDLTLAVQQAFASFAADDSLLALPLALTDGKLNALPPVPLKDSSESYQIALNELDTIVEPRTPLYLILRRNSLLFAITFAPYLAKDTERKFFLENRFDLVQLLGETHFSQSLICKEVGEITDARSWHERDENKTSHIATAEHAKEGEVFKEEECEGCNVKDLGYKQNKCRLCDRRMKNKITPEAISALGTVSDPGAAVQIVCFHYFQTPRRCH
jgi:twinfilin-like protein